MEGSSFSGFLGVWLERSQRNFEDCDEESLEKLSENWNSIMFRIIGYREYIQQAIAIIRKFEILPISSVSLQSLPKA